MNLIFDNTSILYIYKNKLNHNKKFYFNNQFKNDLYRESRNSKLYKKKNYAIEKKYFFCKKSCHSIKNC